VAPSQLGSVEFAAAHFRTRLVVVLGHSNCGAVRATLEQLRQPPETQSRNLRSLVERVRPAVEGLLQKEPGQDMDELMRRAVRANIDVGTTCATDRRFCSNSSARASSASLVPSTRWKPESSSFSTGRKPADPNTHTTVHQDDDVPSNSSPAPGRLRRRSAAAAFR
jgi:hypothetical protein